MPSDVIMPALGLAQETGKVVRWLKGVGDAVTKGEALLEIETDKVTVELESPATGVLESIAAAEGTEVPVGQTIAVVAANGVAPPAPRERRVLASPKARRLAAEQGVDLGTLAGSGPGGAVLAADVPAAEEARAPASPVRRLMAERTARSWQSVPHFYLRREVDAMRLRSWQQAARSKPGLERVSHTDLLVKLVAEALRRHPGVNALWLDGSIVLSERIGIGVAVAFDDGLVVPVVHDADSLSLAQITRRRLDLVEAARSGRLRPDDLERGTFTISNLGMYGVDGFDAIVNAPQAAILAVGRIADRVVPVDGVPVVRPTVQVSVSFDHRAVDGARGARFLETLAVLIEEPAGLVE
jgi:pyruvate dehydrogenase E2 component (dihydrolipoyllysine-residue acetyltransferase)